MEISEEIYLVSDDLFRVGNSQSPRLDNVRERDIEIVEREEESVVLPDTGGISAFSKINPRLRGTWWKCPAGTFYPPELRVVCDRERGTLRHYSIQPAFPMTLRLYQEKLREFAGDFERVQFFDGRRIA